MVAPGRCTARKGTKASLAQLQKLQMRGCVIKMVQTQCILHADFRSAHTFSRKRKERSRQEGGMRERDQMCFDSANAADPSAPPAHESMHCRSNACDWQPILIVGWQQFCCYCCLPQHTNRRQILSRQPASHWILTSCDASHTLVIASLLQATQHLQAHTKPAQQQQPSNCAFDPLLVGSAATSPLC